MLRGHKNTGKKINEGKAVERGRKHRG